MRRNMLCVLIAIVISGCTAVQYPLPNFGSQSFIAPAGRASGFDMETYQVNIREAANEVAWSVKCANPTDFMMTATFTPAFAIYTQDARIEWEAKPEPVVQQLSPHEGREFSGTFPLPEQYRGKKLMLMSNDKYGRQRFAFTACGVEGKPVVNVR